MPVVVPQPVSIDAGQRMVARTIITTGTQLGATQDEILGALSAADVESHFHPTSVGDNGQAVGVFQQWPSYGTVAQRQNVATAAAAFFRGLFGTRSQNVDIGTRVANVQRPAGWHPGGPGAWTGPNPFLYGSHLGEALYVDQSVVNATATPVTVSDPTGGVSQDAGRQALARDLSHATGQDAPNALKVLHTLDDVLNDGGGILDVTKRVELLVARIGVVALGGVLVVFGVFVVAEALGKPLPPVVKSVATDAAEGAVI